MIRVLSAENLVADVGGGREDCGSRFNAKTALMALGLCLSSECLIGGSVIVAETVTKQRSQFDCAPSARD